MQAGWCQIELVTGSTRTILGSESTDVVREALIRATDSRLRGTPCGTIDGCSVLWVLSLSEAHGSVYAADVGESRLLFVQASTGMTIGRLSLSAARRSGWSMALHDGVNE